MSPQRLGQHFLADAGWRRRILAELRPQPDQAWLEIGAGHGQMTLELAPRVAQLTAIELDPPLAARLRERTREMAGVRVVEADILDVDLRALAGASRAHVYGSLPYYITSPILRKLFEASDALESIHVVIQFEVAARIVARPGGRACGFLSVLAQYFAEPRIAFRIPPGAFRPPPKVASALISMPLRRTRPLPASLESEFLTFAGRCFEKKRKTLLNNLKAEFTAEATQAALAQCRLRADARAEQLSIPELAELFQALRK